MQAPRLLPDCTALLLLLISFICPTAQAGAAVHEALIAGDYFGAGADASPTRPVEGDAFIAAAQVDLNQPVRGDALLAGGRVGIAAPVGGNLYATGARVVMDTQIAGNARLTGGHLQIGKRGQVLGKSTLVGGRVSMLGKAGRQLTVFAEHVTLDGEVDGNVTIAARTLAVGPSARVSGKLTYRGSAPAQIDPAAVIGSMSYLSFDFEHETYQPVAKVIAWVGVIACTVGLFFIGMLGIVFLPDSTAHMSTLGRRRPISSLGLGLVAILCVPVAVVLLMLSIVGIPFAFLLLLVWPMILIFGYLAGVMALSDAIAGPSAKARGRRIFLLAMGLGVMLLFARVPFVGLTIGMLLLALGIGAMALTAMGAGVPVKLKKQNSAIPDGTGTEPAARKEPTLRVD